MSVLVILAGCVACCPLVNHVKYALRALLKGKKSKASHTCYRTLGPELIPVYRQSDRMQLKSSTRR